MKIQGVYVLDVAALKQSVRSYELTNHLGNVLSTITDKGVITSAQDYFPFGLTLASRSFTEGGSVYRYSFNGKEDDKALKQQDYGARINRPDLGRFLSVDPLTQEYPWYTPYQFAGNKPIWAIDLDGLEELFATEILFRGRSFISFKYNQRVQSNDIGTMQYTYLDGSRVPINIPIRVISPSEIAELRAQSQAANGAGTFSLTKRIPGTLKPSPPPPPPALVPDDRPTPDKVITENKGPSSNSPPPGTRRGRGTSTKSDDKKAPEDIISSKIKFGPSSNAVLEGWDEIWRITVLLKNDPNLKITVSASAGYAKGEYKNEKETPTGFFGPVMNTASNVINEVTGLQKIGTTGGGTTGELIDIRGQRIKKALIDNGISPDRISTERGGMYPTPDGRTVKFSFKKI